MKDNWNSFQNKIAIDGNYDNNNSSNNNSNNNSNNDNDNNDNNNNNSNSNNNLNDGSYISEMVQAAIEKKVFLLVSCTVNEMKKKIRFQNKQNTQFLKFPLKSNDQIDFFNEINNTKESSSYSFNDGNDFLYVIPSYLFHENNENRDDRPKASDGFYPNNSFSQNHGIEIEFASVCLSPPLSNENEIEMEMEIENGKAYSGDQNDFLDDYSRGEKYVRAGTCTVRTIESQLEILLLPSAKTDR